MQDLLVTAAPICRVTEGVQEGEALEGKVPEEVPDCAGRVGTTQEQVGQEGRPGQVAHPAVRAATADQQVSRQVVGSEERLA